MNKLLLIFCMLISSQCFGQIDFVQKDIGISFSYENPMDFDFNPHSMRKTKIFLDGKHVGGFVVSVIPDSLTIDQFLSVGDEWYKNKYSGAKVSMSEKHNSFDNQYYQFTAEFNIGGVERVEDKFIFIKKRDIGLGKSAFMTYTFTFTYPVTNFEYAKQVLQIPIMTMNYSENEAHFNMAIKVVSGL